MAQDTTPAIIVYQGDGSNTVFSVPFDKGYYGEVKVLFVRRGLADYTYFPNTYTVSGRLYAWANGGSKIYTHTPNPAVGAPTYNSHDVEQANTVAAIAGQTITVDSTVYSRAVQHDIMNNLLLTWTGTTLAVGDFICIARDTQRGQPYELPNNQKHIEMALDNLERQIQEVKDATDNALLVDPSHTIADSHKMAPVDWMKSIIRCMDFSVRALRYANGWLDYSLDDPNIADGSKTWVHLLNADNIKNVRERSDVVDGETIYWTEYQSSDGTWRTLSNAPYWESRIQYAVDTAEEAKDTAEDAKDVADDAKDLAQDAKDIADTFDGRLTQAESDASNAKNTVNNHVTNYNNPHQVTKAQVGLGNCDNTSDLNKPISTATQTALDGKMSASVKYGATITVALNTTDYKITTTLKDQDGNTLGSAQVIDLPLESVVVNGTYDDATKKIILTLENGNTIEFSVADLVSGLQTEITSLNMLGADLVDDSTSTHKFVTASDKTTWDGKQDAISDLSTIRSGAAAGATAVQPADISDMETQTHASSTYATISSLATVATSGSYSDLTNKPTIPDAQIQSDWNQSDNTKKDFIKNKPSLATVATSGSYSDLSNKPTLGTAAAADATDFATATQGGKADTAVQPGDLATVATSGSYSDLSNKPTLGTAAAADSTDFATATQGGKADTAVQPGDLATVATSGSYNDLSSKPTIPTVNDATITFTQGGVTKGTITLNQSSASTIAFDAGGGGGGAVDSVNGYTGTVVLTASDVDALPDTTPIPANTSDLNNDSGFITSSDIPVTSVNSKTGAVTLTASDVGALPDSTSIPANTSDLNNDSGFITSSDIPVTSVNSKTGAVTLTASDVGAQATITGAATTITTNNLAAARAAITDANGKMAASTTTSTELGYLSGVTSSVQTQLNNKANSSSLATVATSGSYNDLSNKPTIPTVNDATITFTQGGVTKGTITLNQSTASTIAFDAGGGGGSVDIDGTTITKNGDDELQAVATVNANTAVGAINPIYDWIGTLAEYEAQDVATNHPTWVCYITDDVEGGASVYTKTQVDTGFVAKGHEVIAFQAPTVDNNHTWYRKYADGWVEQGGVASGTTSATANLPITMSDSEYTVVLGNTSTKYEQILVSARTTTSFTVRNANSSSPSGCYWYVAGMAAS